MSLELVRDKLSLEQKIGTEKTQVLLEGDIIVPDVKPDMSVLLQTEAGVVIDKTEVSTDRVNFIGRLDFQILYLARTPDRPVHAMKATAVLDDFVNMEGLTRESFLEVRADLTHIEYRMLNDRKISYRAVIDVEIQGERTEIHDIVVQIDGVPDHQLLKKKLEVNRVRAGKEDRFIVKDSLGVPSGKPNIREVLLSDAVIRNREARTAAGRVNVTGEILVTTLYKGDTDDSLIEFVENELPFNGTIELPDVREDMQADVTLIPQQQYVQVRPDADGEDRVLEIEVSVGVRIRVHAQETLEVLEDAYCINKNLNMNREQVRFPCLICRNRNQSPIKEVVHLEDHCPDMLQIFRVTGRPQLDDVRVMEDKVVVEGIIHTDIFYVAESDETPLYSYKTVLPFKQVIETRGACEDMTVVMDATIDHVGFNMLSGKETEVRFLLSFNTLVNEEIEVSMIADIECTDMEPAVLDSMPSMTVYVVQNDDSLWKIAKRYNTDLEELISVNEIENPARVFPGQKLLILKKVAVE